MSLTPFEEIKLQKYFDDCNVPECQQDRIRTIAEMSKDEVPIKNIRQAVRSSFNFVGECRSKLRRRGVY